MQRKILKMSLRANTESSARLFMETDEQAKVMVAKLCRSMRLKLKDKRGAVNDIQTKALALSTTQTLFIENRVEQRKDELKMEFRKREEASFERLEDEKSALEDILDRGLAVINRERGQIEITLRVQKSERGTHSCTALSLYK